MTMTRRTFMKVSGAAGAGAYVVWRFGVPELGALAQAPLAGSDEKYVPSVCLQCPAACGILVRVVDGRAVKIEGNPLHPINEGKLCPKGQIGLHILYDPDRIKGPLKRVGPRGGGQWQQISWEEALDAVAGHLRELRERGEPHKLVLMSGRNRGEAGTCIDRFMAAYGSPNHVGHSSICADGSPQAHYLTQGFKAYAAYDWDNTNYLLCFGGAFIEAWRPTTRLLRAFGHMRRGRPVRAKIVQVDTRLSVTAAKADEWVSVKPGTDAALALSIAHVIVDESLYDAAFLRARTDAPLLMRDGVPWVKREYEVEKDGKKTKHKEYYVWDEAAQAPAIWRTETLAYEPSGAIPAILGEHEVEGEKVKTVLETWKEDVLDDATPSWAEGVTGVEAATIERIAREFAATKPAIAAGERGSSMQTNGVYNRMAIHALNALVGSIDTKGGVMVQLDPPLKSWPAFDQDDIAKKGNAQPRIDWAGTKRYPMAGKVYQDLPEIILGDAPEAYAGETKVDTLLTYYTNPFFSTPDTERFYRAIEKVPFIVTFSPFMDETSAYADYILPDHTYLERYQYDTIYPSLGFPVTALRQPVVEPLYDTKESISVLIELAKRIGGGVPNAYPGWSTNLDAINHRLSGLQAAQKGNIVAPTYEEFWGQMLAKGVWFDKTYKFGDWKRVFATDSKRFELFSMNLEHKIEDLAKKDVAAAQKEGRTLTLHEAEDDIFAGLGLVARGETAFFPHYEPPVSVGDATLYPLLLNTYKPMNHAEGRGANVPHLQEVASSHAGVRWGSWVEIHPGTARELGIADGDDVWVESEVGRIRTRARLYEGARPDVVNMPFENGHKEYGRYAKGLGANPNEIMAHINDRLGGLAAFFSTRVRVSKANGGDA